MTSDNPSSRILKITSEADGFQVLLGFSEGFLSGHGWFLYFVKQNGEFVAKSHGEWVS